MVPLLTFTASECMTLVENHDYLMMITVRMVYAVQCNVSLQAVATYRGRIQGLASALPHLEVERKCANS